MMIDHDTAIIVFAAFFTFWTVERGIKLSIKTFLPNLHDYLSQHRKQRDAIFYVFMTSLFGALLSAPYCTRASYTAFTHPIKDMEEWRLDADATVCSGIRVVVWLSELHRLGAFSAGCIHHTFALLAGFLAITQQWPIAMWTGMLASLVSEVPRLLVTLFAIYMDSVRAQANSSDSSIHHLNRISTFVNILKKLNVIQYFILRVGILLLSLYGVTFLWVETNDSRFNTRLQCYGFLFLYAVFLVVYLGGQIRHLLSSKSTMPPLTRTISREEKADVSVEVSTVDADSLPRPLTQRPTLPSQPVLSSQPNDPVFGIACAALAAFFILYVKPSFVPFQHEMFSSSLVAL